MGAIASVPTATPGVSVNATGEAPKTGAGSVGDTLNRQTNMMENAQWANIGVSAANGILAGYEAWAKHDLAMEMFGLQREQMTAFYKLEGDKLTFQGTLVASQEKIQTQAIKGQVEIAGLQKEQNVAIARTRADAAVKIAKVNALNSQFYGQANSLPNWNS